MRAGRRRGGRDRCTFSPRHPCTPPRSLSTHLFSYPSIYPPLAPISECGALSYGMALQCAETAEVMDADRVHAASCPECK